MSERTASCLGQGFSPCLLREPPDGWRSQASPHCLVTKSLIWDLGVLPPGTLSTSSIRWHQSYGAVITNWAPHITPPPISCHCYLFVHSLVCLWSLHEDTVNFNLFLHHMHIEVWKILTKSVKELLTEQEDLRVENSFSLIEQVLSAQLSCDLWGENKKGMQTFITQYHIWYSAMTFSYTTFSYHF